MNRRNLSPPVVERPAGPNERARQITGRDYLSHTQLALMRACPRKFAFGYVENAPRDFSPSSLLFGGAIHAALERHFRGLLEGQVIGHVERLAAFDLAWRQGASAGDDVPVRYNAGESESSLRELADRMLGAFADSPLAHPGGEIVGVEEHLRVRLAADLPDLVAKVDLVHHDDAGVHIIDFKTARSRWSPERASEGSEQLQLYASSLRELAEGLDAPVHLHLGVLTKTKSPVLQLLDIVTDPDRRERSTQAAREVWLAIEAGHYYPSPSPMNCTTCPYRSRCPAHAG
jgi:RecB family exonuclease